MQGVKKTLIGSTIVGVCILFFGACSSEETPKKEENASLKTNVDAPPPPSTPLPTPTPKVEVPSEILELSSAQIRVVTKKEIDRNMDSSIDSALYLSYDPLGNIETQTELISTSISQEKDEKTFKNTYNKNSQLISQNITTAYGDEYIEYNYENSCENSIKSNVNNAHTYTTKHCYNNNQELLSTTEYFNADEILRMEYTYDTASKLIKKESYDSGILSSTTTYETGLGDYEKGLRVIYMKEKTRTQSETRVMDIKKIIYSDTHEQLLKDTNLDGKYDELTNIEYKIIERVLSNGYSTSDIFIKDETVIKP